MLGNVFTFFIFSLPMFYRFGEEMRPVKLTTKVFGTCRISKANILTFLGLNIKMLVLMNFVSC